MIINRIIRIIPVCPDRITVCMGPQRIRNSGKVRPAMAFCQSCILFKAFRRIHVKKLVNKNRLASIIGPDKRKLFIHGLYGFLCRKHISKTVPHGYTVHQGGVLCVTTLKSTIMRCSCFSVSILCTHRIDIQPDLHRQSRKYLLGIFQKIIQEVIVKIIKQLKGIIFPGRNIDIVIAGKYFFGLIIFVHLF